MATLNSRIVATGLGTWSYQCLFLFPCICQGVNEHTFYHISVGIVLLPILGTLIWHILLSHKTVHSLHLLSVSVRNIFIAWYLFCNAWRVAIISLSFSPFWQWRKNSSPQLPGIVTLFGGGRICKEMCYFVIFVGFCNDW